MRTAGKHYWVAIEKKPVGGPEAVVGRSKGALNGFFGAVL
jgi:hypothetical protein